MFKKHHQNLCFFIRGACFYHEKVRTLDYKGVRTGILCGFEFYRTAIYGNLKAVRSREKCNALQQETHRSAMDVAMRCVGQLNGMDYFCYSASLILPDGKRTDMFQIAAPYGSHRRLSTRTAIPGWLYSWQEQ